MSILANEDREASSILTKNSSLHKSFRTISFIVDDIYKADYRSWVSGYLIPAIPSLAAGREHISDNGGYPYVFGGFALDDSFDLPLCSQLGLSIQDYYSPLVNSNKIFEFNAKSDLNAMAIYMGAKPGNRVRMILNGVTREPIISYVTATGRSSNPNSYNSSMSTIDYVTLQDSGPKRSGSGFYMLYPYRSWDYLSSRVLPVQTKVYTEYPIKLNIVKSTRDAILGGNLYVNDFIGKIKLGDVLLHPSDSRFVYVDVYYYSTRDIPIDLYIKHPSLAGGQLDKNYIKPYSMAQMVTMKQDYWAPEFGSDRTYRYTSKLFDVEYTSSQTYNVGIPYNSYSIFPNQTKQYDLHLGQPGFDYSRIISPSQYLKTDSVLALMTIESNTTTVITNNNNNNNVYNVNNVARPVFPSPSATPTQTPTVTGTPRSTPTNTPTKTPTPSVTPTKPAPTPTPSNTPVNRGALAVVRDINNPPYKFTVIDDNVKLPLAQGVGSVSLPYSIGKYEITNTEYAEFLNAVGQNNANDVYLQPSSNDLFNGISRSGNLGSYVYSVIPGYANKPVVYVSWLSAARYCNWLHKNKPVDATGGSLNDGSYDLTVYPVKRSAGAKYWIPSIDEWIKAGFYDPTTGGYYLYGTKSNTIPQKGAGGTTNNGAVYSNPSVLSNVGSYVNSTSHYGLYDVSGNVAEWTDTFYDKYIAVVVNSSGSATDPKTISIERAIPGGLNFRGPGLGFRIATITNFNIQEQNYILSKQLNDPAPISQRFYIPGQDKDTILRADKNYTGTIRYYRFMASYNPKKIGLLTKPIYVGKDKQALENLQQQNITFAFEDGAEKLVEYEANSDLYAIALDMGAKPGDFVQLEVTYVWRPYKVVPYVDDNNKTSQAIVPYRSSNPIKMIDNTSCLLSNVKIEEVNGGFYYEQGFTGYSIRVPMGIKPIRNLDFIESLSPDKIVLNINDRWNPSIYFYFSKESSRSVNIDGVIVQYPYTSYSNDYTYTANNESLGLLRYDLAYNLEKTAFDTFIRSSQGEDWLSDVKEQVEKINSMFRNFGGQVWSQYTIGFDRRPLWNFVSSPNYSNYPAFASLINEVAALILPPDRSLEFDRQVLAYYKTTRDFLIAQMGDILGRCRSQGKYSILVRMRTAKTEKDLNVFLTQSKPSNPVRQIINPNNLFFISNPNYNSGIKDVNHLNEYVLNPGNVKLISTLDSNKKPSLLAKTKYVINNSIFDRKIIVAPSSSYTIEKYKNDVYTITFNNNIDGPVEISYALGDSGFGVTTATPPASLVIQKYTVNVSKLKTIASFTKSFWIGGSITAYTNDRLISNAEYLKYKPELSKYRFKAFYRMLAGPSAGNSWIEIESNELDGFTSEYKYQILIQSGNLNQDVLFPGEGSEANPGYSNYGANTSMNFIVNVIPKSTEIRVAGINLSSDNVVGAKLSSTTNSNITTVSLDIPMNFDKQIEIVLSHFSALDKNYLKIIDPEFTITNVAGCNKDYVSLEYWSNSYGYDQKNPQNFSKKLNVPTATNPGMDAYQSAKGSITILCKIPATQGYGAASATIIINWTIVPSKDIMEPISLPILYTGDDASISSSFGVSLSSDSDSKTKQTKTITVSDNRILKIIRDNTWDSYSIQTPKVDTSDASILNALKTASITISTSGNRYYLPVKETIPVKIYPNNARLTSVASNKFAYVTSGISHFLGIRGEGKLFVWGTNTKGVFAGSDFVQYGTNVILHPENKKWVQVETYGYNVYAIDIEGTLWGWGGNENASLGVGRDGVINTPTKILPNLKWKDIACGFNHAIGLTDDGKVYGWGDGTFLQNGCGSKTGTSVNTNIPTLIKNVGEVDNNGFVGALKVSCGPYSSWVIDKDSYVWAFGDLNGMITNVSAFRPSSPAEISWGTDFRKLQTNSYLAPLTHHTINYSLYSLKIAAGRDNIIFTIPNNLKHKWQPHKIKVQSGSVNIDAINISASANHVIAIRPIGAGQAYISAWGNNIWNQCFITNPPNKYYVRVGETTPVSVTPKIEDGSFIAASPGQSLFIDTSNRLWVIGRNVSGELSGFYNANATYYQTLRNIPGQYSVVTANATGGFTEIK